MNVVRRLLRGRDRGMWGWGASSLIHLLVLAFLGMFLLPPEPPAAAPAVVSAWTAELDPTLTGDPLPLLTLPASIELPGGSPAPFRSVSFSDSSGGVPRVSFDRAGPRIGGPEISTSSLSDSVGTGNGGIGRGTGTGVGDGSGSGSPPEFFPVKQSGGRYVFVVDASRSMNRIYTGPARTRLGRAKIELWRTILKMQSDQQYYIIFFNTQAMPMPSSTMRPAGPVGNEDIFRWTASVPGDGNTDPQSAVLMALQLQPDVIYLLTDGQFNFGVVREATRANRAGVRIDTISLSDDIGSKVLVELARRNNGEYRHIVEAEDLYWDEVNDTAAGN